MLVLTESSSIVINDNESTQSILVTSTNTLLKEDMSPSVVIVGGAPGPLGPQGPVGPQGPAGNPDDYTLSVDPVLIFDNALI